jgi:prevent-host-death family protein
MTKVSIAGLRAHLRHYLRHVRAGRILTVMDRSTPVATIVPYTAVMPLEVRAATCKPSDVPLPSPVCGVTDSTTVLMKDRASR